MELAEAEMVLGLCQQFSCTPSQLEREDAGVLRLMEIVRLGNREGGVNGGE